MDDEARDDEIWDGEDCVTQACPGLAIVETLRSGPETLLRVGLDSALGLWSLRPPRREGSPIGTSTFRGSICLLVAAERTRAAEYTGGAAARACARLRKSGDRSTLGGKGSDPSI
jgi:hypothetical protein